MRKILPLIAILLSLSLCITGCTETGTARVNLMEGITAESGDEKKPDYVFTLSQYEVTSAFLKELSVSSENFMFSPASLSLACGLAMNGAEGQTKTELENFFCMSFGSETYNRYMKAFMGSLKSEVKNAASIWYRNDDRLTVNKDFLQKNADYYNASAFKVNFNNDGKTAVNDWVKEATDGNIDSIIDDIDKNTMMFLINALTFEAEWQNPYSEKAVSSGTFKAKDKNYTVEMMKSTEDMYIEYGGATGFIKPYKNADYLFAVLLPEENVSLADYAATLSGDKLKNTIDSAAETTVYATMPKFQFNYSFTADEILKKSGVEAAFDEDKADFSAMAKVKGANLYIGEVLQKTYISVAENGTKAGAVTKVEMAAKTSLSPDTKTVTLDRPFIFMILDADTKIPVFTGAVNKF